MVYADCNTEMPIRQKGKHLRIEDRHIIWIMHRQKKSYREIAKELNCSPSTVCYELRRGTPPRTGKRGRPKAYSPVAGQEAYERNRSSCHKPCKFNASSAFALWVVQKFTEDSWSLDVCSAVARKEKLFPADQLVCTKTLYNAVWSGRFSLSPIDLPEALTRKQKPKGAARKNVKIYGKSIEDRPKEIAEKTQFGHWEIDTVVGRRKGKEAVILTLAEKRSRMYLAMKIPGKNADSVMRAMKSLQEEYGSNFSNVFKSITSDNGTEFSSLAQLSEAGTMIYFAHPYSSWERPQNERFNKMLRTFVPKGCSINNFSNEDILSFADKINSLPRRVLGYESPEKVFDSFLDSVYAVSNSNEI